MNPPAPSCRSTGKRKGRGLFRPLPFTSSASGNPRRRTLHPTPGAWLSLLPRAGIQCIWRRKRTRRGRPRLPIRERKSPSGVLTNPSFPCKMERRAGRRPRRRRAIFGALAFAVKRAAARPVAERSGEEAAMFLSAQCAASHGRLNCHMRSRCGGVERPPVSSGGPSVCASRKTECASYASAAQSDGMLL